MALGKMFEKTIKLVGTVSKVGVQLGADIVGTVAEKINDDPEVKRRISEYGAKKGQSIKAKTTEIASKSSNIVDRAIESSRNVLKDGSVRIKDSVSQVAEGVGSSIKDMKNYNSQTMQDHSNTLPIKTYSISEIEGFSNYDFLLISKFISVSNKVVFDIIVKRNDINIGDYILINNTSGNFATRIISIDSAVNEYDILKDGTINIMKKGVPRCRELYNTVTRNEILSIVVQGTPANCRFVGRNELAKGTIITEKNYNECSNIKLTNTRYQKSENKVSSENIPEMIDIIFIGLKSENGQKLIKKLKIGDSVKLIREPNNIYNNDAIAIYNVDSEMLGYIAKDDEKELAKAMDLGVDYKASVTSKVCGDGLISNVYVQVSKVYIKSYTSTFNTGYQNKNTECSDPSIKEDKKMKSEEPRNKEQYTYNRSDSKIKENKLMDDNVNKKEPIVTKSSSDNREKAFSDLEQMLNKASETIVSKGGSSAIGRIMNVADCEVYSEILVSLNGIKQGILNNSKTMFGKIDLKKVKVAVSIDKLEKKVESATATIVAGATDKITAMNKVKAMAVIVFKKVVALPKGVLSFKFDTTTILGAAIGRITYNTARELILGDKSKNNNISNNDIWNLIICEIELDNNPYDGPQLIGNNFYIGSPVCPHCNESMFKTVFPVGGEYKIDTSRGVIKMKRVFTCLLCKVFFTPIPGNRVSDGMVFERKFLSKGDYEDALEHMDKHGSLKGRMDL